MYSNFSDELKKVLNGAKKEMKNFKHSYIGTEHFILSILKSNNEIKKILNSYEISYDKFKSKIIECIGYGSDNDNLFVFTPLFKKIIEDSIFYSNEERIDEVTLSMLFKVMLDEAEGVAFRIFCDLGVDVDSLYDSINISINKIKPNGILKEVGINLNEKVKKDNDIVIGRDKEIDYIIEILLRKNKSNPILVGDAGVGKTAVVEALALRINSKNVPLKLINKKIISVSIASLVSGTKYRGEFEEKVLKIIKELEDNNDYILFIDEIHTVMGAGGAEGAIDASNILKPALARGNITIIGATTFNEYKKYIEDDKAFARRFQKVIIKEPNDKDLLNILKKVKCTYEKYHNVIISDSILKYITMVSKKYIINRKEPDRSLDILDEVSSLIASKISEEQINNNLLKKELVKINNKKQESINNNDYNKALEYRKKERIIESKININEINLIKIKKPIKVAIDDVNKVISQKYNILINNFKNIKSVIKEHKQELKEYIMEQDTSIEDIITNIENIFVGSISIEKPISFLFIGKTNLPSKLSELYFNNNIIKINLNEYKDQESINKIIGSAPGYIGYSNKNNIFEKLKDNPFSIILFENYEKANKRVKDLIKQILDIGYFIDSNNYKINFLNSLIIITSNKSNNNNIGFMNNNIDYDDLGLSNYVTKVIKFSDKLCYT